MKTMTIAESDYHADRTAVSKSWLDKIERSPAHLKAYLDGTAANETTPAMALGSLTHAMILEPERFSSDFVMCPRLDKRTKAGKEAWVEFEDANTGKIVVPEKDWLQAEAMRDAVYEHPSARKLLTKGDPEQTVFWNDSNTGEKCKARADWLRENFIVDLKTTADASPAGFAKSIANFRYHVQNAHYTDGFDLERFVFIAVEKAPPYGVAVYVLDEDSISKGTELRKRNMDVYAECKARNEWPGYSELVETINLPRWAS